MPFLTNMEIRFTADAKFTAKCHTNNASNQPTGLYRIGPLCAYSEFLRLLRFILVQKGPSVNDWKTSTLDIATICANVFFCLMGTSQAAHSNGPLYCTAIWWLVHWPLMSRLLHLVQRGGAWVGCGPDQSPHRCTKWNTQKQPTVHQRSVYQLHIIRCGTLPVHALWLTFGRHGNGAAWQCDQYT